MSTEIRKVHLEYIGGSSYKEYNIIVTQKINGLYDLNSHYGRIGGSQVHRDIKLDIGLSEVMSEYKSVLRKKERKGYDVVSTSDKSRFTHEYVQSLIQSTQKILDEGIIEKNHYDGLIKLLKTSDNETLEMAEKIIVANINKLENQAA